MKSSVSGITSWTSGVDEVSRLNRGFSSVLESIFIFISQLSAVFSGARASSLCLLLGSDIPQFTHFLSQDSFLLSDYTHTLTHTYTRTQAHSQMAVH